MKHPDFVTGVMWRYQLAFIYIINISKSGKVVFSVNSIYL